MNLTGAERSSSGDENERIVHERLSVIRDLLQARKSRIGLSGAVAHASVRAAIGSFAKNAKSAGWTQTFDALVRELHAAASRSGHEDDAREFTAAAHYLLEIEPHIVHLARQTQQSPALTQENAPRWRYLKASHKSPVLHAYNDSTVAREFVEPTESAHLRVLCRDVLDELASLASLRVPNETDPWTIGATFEERLLQMLDAAMAMSRGSVRTDMVYAARKRAEASPIADPWRWFVPAFLLACTAGNPALDALREILLEAPRGVQRGLVDALCLGSNPSCTSIADSLFDEDDRPDLLAIALDVAARRGSSCPNAIIALLEHPDPRIVERAIHAAVRVVDRPRTAEALLPLLDREELVLQAASGLTLVAPHVGANALRDAMRKHLEFAQPNESDEPLLPAAETLAALGQAQDESLLLIIAERMDRAIVALSIHGLRSEMNWLLAKCLRDDTPLDRKESCVRALERITGIFEEDDPSPGGRMRERARFLELVREFVRVNDAARLRRGKPFHASAILEELSESRTAKHIRRGLLAEAILLGAPRIGTDLEGWIALQEEWLRAAKEQRWGSKNGERARES